MKTKAIIKNIGDIRKWLDTQEEDFNDKGMSEMFGAYEDQQLLMPHITNTGDVVGYGEFSIGYSADGVYIILDVENVSAKLPFYSGVLSWIKNQLV